MCTHNDLLFSSLIPFFRYDSFTYDFVASKDLGQTEIKEQYVFVYR